jgi:predicted metalloprotease
MQRSGKSHSVKENSHKSRKSGKRRVLALTGSFAGLILLATYLIAAAYPTSPFSKSRKTETVAQPVAPAPVHDEFAADPFKNSSEELITNNNEVMKRLFKKMGEKYTAPSLQFFQDSVTSVECGAALPSAGLFYCPASKQIYVDLGFFKAIEKRHPLFTELAQYYAIAHQAGHHIEQLLGITAKIEEKRDHLTNDEYHKLLYKQELLADYYAGVWMHYAWTKRMEDSDAELAIIQATEVSNDLDAQDDIDVPDTYHYANISERANWLYKGYRTGDLKQGDVFAAADLK